MTPTAALVEFFLTEWILNKERETIHSTGKQSTG